MSVKHNLIGGGQADDGNASSSNGDSRGDVLGQSDNAQASAGGVNLETAEGPSVIGAPIPGIVDFSNPTSTLGNQSILDLPAVTSGANSTLGFSQSAANGAQSANLALLGNYMASSFVTPGHGLGGVSVVDPLATSSNQPTLLTQSQPA